MISDFRLSLSFGDIAYVMKNAQPCLEVSCNSAVLSAAHYLCHLFYAQQADQCDLVVSEPFPTNGYDEHRSYIAWNMVLNRCILDGQAVREGNTLCFDIQLG
jgi:hypothetical protein